jgi:diguanylate cyclase (GGDEF)-like protein/PAS domain S-box-containing protein
MKTKTRRGGRTSGKRGAAPARATPGQRAGRADRYRSTFDQAAVGILHATVDGRILEANRALCEMLGYTGAELASLSTRDLTYPEDRDRQDSQRVDLVSGKSSRFTGEKRYLRKDGGVIWVTRTVTLARAPGTGAYLIQTIEDITERKRTEQALQQSQKQYAGLVDSLESIVWEADPQTFQFYFVSRQAEKLLGYPVERWLADRTFWQNHIHPDDRKWAVDYCVAATGELRSHDFEYRMIAADGRVVWLRDLVNVVVENGRAVRSRGVMIDITAGKQAEANLRRATRARTVMAECSHVLVHAANETEMLERMCRIAVESGGYHKAWIGLATGDLARPVVPAAHAGYGEAGPMQSGSSWGADGRYQGSMGRVISSGKAYIANDILNNTEHLRLKSRALDRGFQSLITLPLISGTAIFGAISIYANEPDAFDHEEVGLLTQLAGDIAFGIGSLRAGAARRQAEVGLRRLTRARRVTAECRYAQIHATSEIALVAEMCRIAVESGGYRQAWIGMATGDPVRPVTPIASAGYGGSAPMVAGVSVAPDGRRQGPASVALESGVACILRDILNDPAHESRRTRAVEFGYQSTIALPLKWGAEAIGVLVLHALERDAFDTDEIGLLDELAADLAFGIAALRARAAGEHAERQLRESEQRVREVFDQVAVGISRSDLHGRIVEANRKFCDMLGYSRDELLGMTIRDITHPDDYGAGAGLRRELQAGARVAQQTREKRFVRKNGTTFWANRTFSAAYDDAGKPTYITSVVEDISDKKELALRFELTFDFAAVGMAISGLDGRYLRVNSRFAAMLGYAPRDLVGKSARDLIPEEDFAETMEIRERLLDGKIDSVTSERRYARLDGSQIWASRTLSLARGPDGAPLYFISVAEDITDRKEVAERYRVTFENAPVGIMHTSLDGGRILHVNARLCDMLGYSQDELLGMDAARFTDPGYLGRDRATQEQMLAGDLDTFSSERIYHRKDGGRLWVRRTASLARDSAGKPLYFIRIIEDITARKDAQEQIARERALLRTVIDALPDRIYVKDRDGRFMLQNATNVSQHGASSADQLLGRTVFDILPESIAAAIDAEDKVVMRTGQPLLDRERATTVRNRDGLAEKRWQLTTKVPLRDGSGNIIGLVGVNRDVTERKRAEEAVRESQYFLEKAQEVGRIGHWVSDPTRAEGRLQWSRETYSIFGLTEAEFDGRVETFFRLVHPKDRDAVSRASAAALAGRQPYSIDHRIIRPDGTVRWVHEEADITRDPDGKPLRMFGVSQDITDHKVSTLRREMEYAVTDILASAPTQQAAMPRLIETICTAMEWSYGASWAWRSETEIYRTDYRSEVEPEFDPADRELWERQDMARPAPGQLLRRVLLGREPVWIADVQRAGPLRRKPSAAKLGWQSAFAFPILAGERTLGLMEFFGSEVRQPDEMMLRIARSIGSQIGQYIQRKQVEQALRQSEEQFRQLAGNIPQAFWMTDTEQKELIYVSPAYQEISGQKLETLAANPRSWLDAIHPDDRERVRAARREAVNGAYDETFRLVRPDGTLRWIHDRAFPVEDETGAVYRIAGIAEDVTSRKLAEEQLLNLAHYDVLTGLPNRVLFYDRLKQSLAQARRNQWIVGVMFIDVDRFKNVNDTLGHAVGDKLLKQVSQRLTGSVRADDTVGRLGGDEFAIVLAHLTTAQDANLVAQKIMASFNEPFRLDGAEIFVTGSIGITLFPDDSTDQDTLIKNADAAMYRAKELGRNGYQFYTPEMNARALELLGMESSLRRALERNEFLLHFQPKASVASGEILGMEALLRWNHPERGMVPPVAFIPVMEETGLIVPAGEWVLKAVCEQIRSWEAAGIKVVPVAVNLSARQFLARDLGPTIKRILEAHRIDPALIELEITESSLMSNTAEAVTTLEYLSGLGVSVSIDDFGTGYSSLAYLKRFPLDALKIDRSFVRDITTDSDDANITRAIISMAHSLGLKVIAEGVETEAQATFLADYGCDQIQGYYLTPALAADDYLAWVRRRGTPQGLAAGRDAPVVLLVDDEEIALVLGRRALAKGGYQVYTAKNAHEAFKVLGEHRIDVVISDHHMPGITGIEFLARVKTLFPGAARIMLSGSADPGTVGEATLRAEVSSFLPKDVNEDRLRSAVEAALRSRAVSGGAAEPASGDRGVRRAG